MGLLEFASRLCAADPKAQAVGDLSRELERLEPRYFATLPGKVPLAGRNNNWQLPHAEAPDPERQLLAALFLLVRHGQAHQGQQTMGTLSDGATFGVSIDGVHDKSIDAIRASGVRTPHMELVSSTPPDIWIYLRPEWLYLDIRRAVEASRLLDREQLPFGYFDEEFKFDSAALRTSLTASGLVER